MPRKQRKDSIDTLMDFINENIMSNNNNELNDISAIFDKCREMIIELLDKMENSEYKSKDYHILLILKELLFNTEYVSALRERLYSVFKDLEKNIPRDYSRSFTSDFTGIAMYELLASHRLSYLNDELLDLLDHINAEITNVEEYISKSIPVIAILILAVSQNTDMTLALTTKSPIDTVYVYLKDLHKKINSK